MRSPASGASAWASRSRSPPCTGRGSGDLLDKILAALPPAKPLVPREAGPRRIALVGRPNVGKSSLLNKLAKEERAVVDPVAGTTVDPVDSLVDFGGETWHLVDTAGLRKRVSHASGTEYYASLRTNAAIEAAEVAIVLLDASEVISEQDQRIITMVIESGRALVVAFNKWDLVDEDPPAPARQGDRTRAAPHPVVHQGQRVGTHRPGPWTSSPPRSTPRWRTGNAASRPASSTSG